MSTPNLLFFRPVEMYGCVLASTSGLTRSAMRARLFISRAVASTSSSRSEEHTSELQSLMRISYAVFCLKKKNKIYQIYICVHYLNLAVYNHHSMAGSDSIDNTH